jgi:hypothetical protein
MFLISGRENLNAGQVVRELGNLQGGGGVDNRFLQQEGKNISGIPSFRESN